ncbi:hypothetical protein F3Y22_tig00111278pilonHSYRG00029 [Hibiscus syriacus]|uniref:Phorbol-ester/DAG-type domain-containing protein n=1 Tax=Hibiscus syriacus TaxID=106335 RepID=A0A6A2YSD2_HIBSY|nr:uncharacterized protein LOC120157913 [Hibiscus syriacus]KAE8681962.1 hypothetical protein F3Y22_tig00111278pilonHSYRG00029 [Hibiscus syriacus]
MEIQHAIHEHPLYFQERSWGNCSACWKLLFGPTYGCTKCEKLFHKSCLDELKLGSFIHFTHFHPTKPVDFKQQEDNQVVCAICKHLCSSSSSSTYGCMECKFFIHKSCLTTIPPQLINHLIHPCTLVLQPVDFIYSCARCRSNCPGRAFVCNTCGFYLDVKCAFDSIAESEEAKEIQHFSHRRPLSLIQNYQQYGNEPRCAACLQTCLPPTPTFRCTKSSCTHFFLHRSCVVIFPHQRRLHDHPCHPKHELTFTSLPFRIPTCGACCWGIDSSLFAYGCYQCEFSLHLDCAKLLPSFDCNDSLPQNTRFHLSSCGVNCYNFVLRCVPCNFNIHLQCLPSIPKTITHKSHLHPLILTNSPFEYELNSEEDAYNSDDEFYCDVCEEKRYKRVSVYHCADSKFIAQLNCVIDEVSPYPSLNHSLV